MRVLVTGGAGFIGSHLVDTFISRGADVIAFDALEPQVHGSPPKPPAYLNPKVNLVVGNLLDKSLLQDVVNKVDVIFHQASVVGVGQSMYEIARYCEGNIQGTANLLEAIINRPRRLDKLVVASSVSIYGEGLYRCERCGEFVPERRDDADLQQGIFEVRCPCCRAFACSLPTREDVPARPTSIYAICKKTQEEMCLCIGAANQIPTIALRYFNVYGTRQALSNPYTGVISIFCNRVLNGNHPIVFEDGSQTRDFVSVHDVVQGNLCALDSDIRLGVYNIGTGKAVSVLELARKICRMLGGNVEPEVVGRYRQGDVRHVFADISRARQELGYEPKVTLEEGLKEVLEWAKQQPGEDRFENAMQELKRRGLIV